MINVLILAGSNHGFTESAVVIRDFLQADPGLNPTLTDDKAILTAPGLQEQDVLVLGAGFTRAERQADGSVARLPEMSPAQEEALYRFVARGKGLVGVHGAGWWIGGRAVDLIGGHANWHPPGSTFTVHVEDASHPVTAGLSDFEVEDEIYMSAYDPAIHILATATCFDRRHPMAWVKPYGQGRVFYTTLGHTADTFRRPAMQRMLRQGVHWAGAGSSR